MQSLLWKILDKRQEYGIQIAGNLDVCEWIHDSSTGPYPEWKVDEIDTKSDDGLV